MVIDRQPPEYQSTKSVSEKLTDVKNGRNRIHEKNVIVEYTMILQYLRKSVQNNLFFLFLLTISKAKI
jgi:hypothetical protein